MPIRINTHFFVAVAGVILFLIFWFAKDERWLPSSAVWPQIILYGIAIFSAILLLQSFILRRREEVFIGPSKARILIACLALFIWILLVFSLGFLVGSLLAFPVMAFYVFSIEKKSSPEVTMEMSSKKVLLWLAIIFIEILVFYYVFSKVLLVPLPEGLFF